MLVNSGTEILPMLLCIGSKISALVDSGINTPRLVDSSNNVSSGVVDVGVSRIFVLETAVPSESKNAELAMGVSNGTRTDGKGVGVIDGVKNSGCDVTLMVTSGCDVTLMVTSGCDVTLMVTSGCDVTLMVTSGCDVVKIARVDIRPSLGLAVDGSCVGIGKIVSNPGNIDSRGNEDVTVTSSSEVEDVSEREDDLIGTGVDTGSELGSIMSVCRVLVVSGPSSNILVASGPSSNILVASGPSSNILVASGPSSNILVASGPSSNILVASGPSSTVISVDDMDTSMLSERGIKLSVREGKMSAGTEVVENEGVISCEMAISKDNCVTDAEGVS